MIVKKQAEAKTTLVSTPLNTPSVTQQTNNGYPRYTERVPIISSFSLNGLQPHSHITPPGIELLNSMVDQISKLSPITYKPHTLAGCTWLLQTIFGRRAYVSLSSPIYPTELYTLVGPSGSAKTTMMEHLIGYANQIRYRGEGLADVNIADVLIRSGSYTPQSLINTMVNKGLPKNFEKMSSDEREVEKFKLMYVAQPGLLIDEESKIFAQLTNINSPNATYDTFIREAYDCARKFVYSTISRGTETILEPALIKLGSTTDEDFKYNLNKEHTAWRTGYLARHIIIAPPEGLHTSDDLLPRGRPFYDRKIIRTIEDVHNNLGFHSGVVQDKKLLVKRKEPLAYDLDTASYTYWGSNYIYWKRIRESEEYNPIAPFLSRMAMHELKLALTLSIIDTGGKGGGISIENLMYAHNMAMDVWWPSVLDMYDRVPDSGSKRANAKVYTLSNLDELMGVWYQKQVDNKETKLHPVSHIIQRFYKLKKLMKEQTGTNSDMFNTFVTTELEKMLKDSDKYPLLVCDDIDGYKFGIEF